MLRTEPTDVPRPCPRTAALHATLSDQTAENALPDAATDTEAFREVVIDVAQWFKARIRCKRFHWKRGRMSQWFWNPCSAERID